MGRLASFAERVGARRTHLIVDPFADGACHDAAVGCFESGGLAAVHAAHDGLTKLEDTHRLLHGEKVAFGLLTQLQLENCPLKELVTITRFLDACDLPTTLDDLGLAEATDDYLLVAAEAACAPDDTMRNMPFEVTPADVVGAMRAASRFSKTVKD